MKSIMTATLLILLSVSGFAKSSRKIVQEDLGGTKAEAVAAPPYSPYAAYTPSAPLAPPATPGIGFPIPLPGATPETLNSAIQSFMNYLTGVNQQGNPQNFPDWVDPGVVSRGQRAPGLPTITGQALDASCDNLPEDAKRRMKDFLSQCRDTMQNQTGKVAINDFSTNTPVMYILNANDLSCVGSTRVTFGIGSHDNPPVAGNGYGSSQSSAGFMVTKPHHGSLYQEWNSIGINGLGSENSNTAGRGVILHPSNGHTLGCIGIPPSRFVTVKRALAYGAVVLNYFPKQIGDSQNRCPYYKGGGTTSKASTTASGVQ